MEELFDKCSGFLANQENYHYFNMAIKEIMEKCLRRMKEDIAKMKNDEDVLFDVKPISTCVAVIHRVIIEHLEENSFLEFCADFSTIAFNWNRNGPKDALIEELCMKISYIRCGSFKVADVISYLRDVCHRVKDLLNTEPTSFRLSKHYFDLLKEQ